MNWHALQSITTLTMGPSSHAELWMTPPKLVTHGPPTHHWQMLVPLHLFLPNMGRRSQSQCSREVRWQHPGHFTMVDWVQDKCNKRNVTRQQQQ